MSRLGETSLTVVERVASDRGVQPTEIAPLQDAVDVDALDALVDYGFQGTCEFRYAGCQVTVEGDGTVYVENLLPEAE